MDYKSAGNGTRIDGDQSETLTDFRVSFASPGQGGLYVIRVPGGPCKIGRTRDLRSRFSKMQTHHPYDLELVCWLPDRGCEELAWHHCFDQFRIRGEWFEWAPAIEDAIALAVAGRDWTEAAEPPPELLDELTGDVPSPEIVEQGRNIYRALLRKWTQERSSGERGTRLPPRANTPTTPKSPGPVPKHRRALPPPSKG